MNFLGHLVLAAPDESHMVGGFLGDFVKGPLRGEYPQAIEQGIQLHRYIDQISDGGDALKHLRQQLPKRWYRYAGIVLDVFIDHQLSLQWPHPRALPLPLFVEDCHTILQAQKKLFPERALRVLNRMQQQRWLESYASADYVYASLGHIGSRLSHANPLQDAQELDAFYPQILAAARLQIEHVQPEVNRWRLGL